MQNNDQRQIAGAIIIAGIIIAGAVLLKGSTPREIVNNQAPTTNTNTPNFADVVIKKVSGDDHILGNKNAKIVIIEYSDIECPFCKVFHETMHQVVKQKPNVAWVFRHYPIPQLHSKAIREAEATECAFEQGGHDMFWKYIDRIFEITPSNDGLEDKELTNTAQYLGLNTSSFYTCLESGKYKDKIAKAMEEGAKAKVNGTPSSYILVNGKVVDQIPGAQPLEKVLERIAALE